MTRRVEVRVHLPTWATARESSLPPGLGWASGGTIPARREAEAPPHQRPARQAPLGTQGDVWDTPWDMALALTGAIVSQLLLSRVHTAQLGRLAGVER